MIIHHTSSYNGSKHRNRRYVTKELHLSRKQTIKESIISYKAPHEAHVSKNVDNETEKVRFTPHKRNTASTHDSKKRWKRQQYSLQRDTLARLKSKSRSSMHVGSIYLCLRSSTFLAAESAWMAPITAVITYNDDDGDGDMTADVRWLVLMNGLAAPTIQLASRVTR